MGRCVSSTAFAKFRTDTAQEKNVIHIKIGTEKRIYRFPFRMIFFRLFVRMNIFFSVSGLYDFLSVRNFLSRFRIAGILMNFALGWTMLLS